MRVPKRRNAWKWKMRNAWEWITGLRASWKFIFRFSHVLLALPLLSFIFWFPPVTLVEDLREKKGMPPWSVGKDTPAAKLLELQCQKVIDEIAANAESMYSWFRYKFLFVGAVFAFLLGNIYVWENVIAGVRQKREDNDGKSEGDKQAGRDDKNKVTGDKRRNGGDNENAQGNKNTRKDKTESPAERLYHFFKSPMGLIILGLSLFVCISIDIQISDRHKGSVHGGLWIRHFVEPAFLRGEDAAGSPTICGWEQFLRDPPGIEKKTEGIHFHWLTTFFHWVPMYSLTFLLYAIYIIFCQEHFYRESGTVNSGLFHGVYLVVHILIIVFSAQIHILPGTLEYGPTGLSWLGKWRPEWFVLASVGLLLINYFPFLFVIHRWTSNAALPSIKPRPLEALGLSAPTRDILQRAGISTIEMLFSKTLSEICCIKGIGKARCAEISDRLARQRRRLTDE